MVTIEIDHMKIILSFTNVVLEADNQLLTHIEQRIMSVDVINKGCDVEYNGVDVEEAIMLVRLLWGRPEFRGMKVIHDETHNHS
jgi:hypothetical protein